MAPPEPRRRRAITTEQRIALRSYAQQHRSHNQQQLASWFEQQFGHRPSQGTISESLSARFSELDQRGEGPSQKRLRTQHWPELEACLYEWQLQIETQVPISNDLIKAAALRFWHRLPIYRDMEVPQFSSGWLEKFKRRHGITERLRHGEAGSINEALIAEQLVAVQAIASQFHPSNTYNCDESGLLWKITPDRGQATQAIAGTKLEKARITVHFCCNADGSHKLPLWFIGKHRKPRAFGAANININSLGCFWRFNGKAWMKTDIMVEWLYWFDQQVTGRKVLLLMDNFSAHTAAVEALKLMPLQNTVICWLPPNSTSKYQPLDQGIIRAWKAHYRKRWLLYMVDQFEAGKNPLKTTNVLKAIRWSIQAWQTILEATITDCWYHSTVVTRPSALQQSSEVTEVVAEVGGLINQLQQQQRIQSAMSIESFLNPAEEAIQSLEMSDNIEEEIAAQFEPQEDHEPEEELEELPHVRIQEAIEALRVLQLYEEQQAEQSSLPVLQQLSKHEVVLQDRRHRSLRQAPITSFFTAV
jgi:hypothetical protein